MNRILIKSIIALFLSLISVSYACDPVVIQLNYYGIVKPKSDEYGTKYYAYLEATVVSGYVNSWDEVFINGNVIYQPRTGYDRIPGGPGVGKYGIWIWSEVAGDNYLTMTANGSYNSPSKTCNFVVNEVDSVTANRTFVTTGTTVTFTAISTPSCSLIDTQWQARYSEDGSSWSGYTSIDSDPFDADFTPSGSYHNPLNAIFTNTGFYQTRARNGDYDEYQESPVVTVFELTITNPYGDPTSSASANDNNEKVFNSLSPGVLTVQCAAVPTPDIDMGIWAFLNDNTLRWTITTISGSTLTWDSSWPGASTKGEGTSCTATFTGLPSSNNSFGLKEVKLEVLLDGVNVTSTKTTNIEVFYTKTATNNPGGTDKNWFYYWNQAVGDPDAKYVNSSERYGRTPAMRLWDPAMTYSKTEIWIYDLCAGTIQQGMTGPTISGIDCFLDVVKHENTHVVQISQADSLLTGNGTGIWVKGWSWNQNPNPNNHYNSSPYDDLDDDDDDIPDAYESASPAWVEPAALAAENTTEGANQGSDWGSPGKMHATIGKYDD